MEIKQTKNIWIGIVVIALVAGAYYFGTTSNNQNTTRNIQDTITPVIIPEQPTPATVKADVGSKSKCASDGKAFVQNYEQQYGSLKTVWQDPQFHYDTKINTCLVYIGYAVTVSENPLDLSTSNYSASLIVYNFIFDIYSNQAILQNVANRKNVNGKNTDTLSSSPNYSNIPNLDGNAFFNQLRALMNE